MFSKLTTKFWLSPNYNPRTNNDKIIYITPHCTDGLLNFGGASSCFGAGTENSCNYLIDNDGTICGIVDENNRAWTSSSRFNDFSAITFELASEKGTPHRISEKVLDNFVALVVDVMKRHNKNKLVYFGDNKEKTLAYVPADNEMVITFHKWYSSQRSCPGEYFITKCPELVEAINKRLSENQQKQPATANKLYYVQVGAFSSKENAEKQVAALRKAGFPAIVK